MITAIETNYACYKVTSDDLDRDYVVNVDRYGHVTLKDDDGPGMIDFDVADIDGLIAALLSAKAQHRWWAEKEGRK